MLQAEKDICCGYVEPGTGSWRVRRLGNRAGSPAQTGVYLPCDFGQTLDCLRLNKVRLVQKTGVYDKAFITTSGTPASNRH